MKKRTERSENVRKSVMKENIRQRKGGGNENIRKRKSRG